MKRTFMLVLLISSNLAWGQTGFRSPAFVGGLNVVFPSGGSVSNFYPTNVGTPFAWYHADSVSNAENTEILSWPDSYTSGFTLTNITGKSPVTSNYNGHCVLSFDGVDNGLRSQLFALAQPFELWFAMMWQPNANQSRNLMGTIANNAYLQYRTTAQLRLNFGSSLSQTNVCTNKWMTLRIIGNGTNTQAYTNNVLYSTGNAGVNGITNIVLGLQDTFQNPTRFDLGEFIIYSATNTIANATDIQNYLTNKYGIIAP